MNLKCLFKLSILTVTAISMLVSSSSTAQAQRQSWDTSYVADDTFFHAGLNVESLLDLEPVDSTLRVMIAEMVQDEMGININDLKQMQFLMGGEAVDDDEDVFQAKFIFNRDQDFDKLLHELFHERFEMAKHDGKEFYLSTRGRGPSAYIPDKQTLIIANEPRLKKLIDSESGMGDMVDTLMQAEGNANVFIAFKYNDQLDEFVSEIAEEMRGLPFDFHDIASEAKSGHLTVMLDSGEPVSASITAGDAEGAERLQRAVEALVALGKLGVPQLRKMMEDAPDFGGGEETKEMKEQASKGLDTADALLEGATVETEGATLTVKTKVMGGIVEGTRAMLNMMILGVRMGGAPPAEARAIEAIEVIDEAEVEVEGVEE